MNKHLLPFLLALLSGSPMLGVKAQSKEGSTPLEETKNTVITFKGDTLIRKINSKITTSPNAAATAWQDYNAAMITWTDTVQKIAKKHQENPDLGAPIFPPMPKEPSKTSSNNIANANTVKKQVVLSGDYDTLYYEYKEFDASGKLVKEVVKIMDEALQNKEVKQIVKNSNPPANENSGITEKTTPPAEKSSENQSPSKVIETEQNYKILLPNNVELTPGVYTIKRSLNRPQAVIHGLRFYYGLNNAYQMNEPGPSFNAFNNTTLLPIQADAMPQLKRLGSDHMGVESSWGYNLIKGKIRFFSGFRYDNFDYRFQDPTTVILPNKTVFTNKTLDPTVDPNPEQIESQLSTHYIGVPIAVGFTSNIDNSNLTIRAGFTANYLVYSSFRTRFKDKSKNKVVDDFNLNDFMLMPTLQMEYGDIGLYMSYSTSSIFRANEAYPMRLLTLGLSLNLS
jgi:hypothetical protein